MADIIQNIILGISLAAPLGPSGITVIKNGLRRGFLPGFITGLGVTSGDATYLLLVFFGLSGLIEIAFVKSLIWVFGAVVLFYLGYLSIKEASAKKNINKRGLKIEKNPFVMGYLVNISNPLAIVWWIGVYGSLLGSSVQTLSGLSALLNSSTILIGILLWHSTMSFLTHWGKHIINEETMKYISIIAGIVLIGFALKFGFNVVSSLF